MISKIYFHVGTRGGSRNSSRRGGGGSGPEFFKGGVRVQVHKNFHILTKKTSGGGRVKPPNTPPPDPPLGTYLRAGGGQIISPPLELGANNVNLRYR